MMENILNNGEFAALEENYKRIRENMAQAALQSGRKPEDITLLAATKTVAPKRINHVIALGVDAVGENRVQELTAKYGEVLLDNRCASHFIGHLQTNKVRQIIDKVVMIQSVDSDRLAAEIDRQAGLLGKTMDILVEVNIGREENKSGVLPEQTLELLEQIAAYPHISVRGLMAIPPICQDKSKLRQYFSAMRQLFIDIREKKIDNISMHCLSMGMSDDYIEAIQEGSTMIRVGSALFGARQYY